MADAAATLTMPGYLPRIAGREVESALRRRGAVLIEGVRGCGKTWMARHFARSEVRLDDEAALLLASADPVEVLRGATPRLLDEWQNAPHLWNRVRRECDDRPEPGQFILTGSAVPQDDVTRHTGTGRISRVLLRPMSLWETGQSTGIVSLEKLFDGEAVSCLRDEAVRLRDIATAICVGGWPQNLGHSEDDALASVGDYANEIARVDIPSGNGVRHDPTMVRRLLASISLNVATEAKTTKLAADMDIGHPPARNTVAAYLDALRRIFVVEDQPAWAVSLRSKATLRKEAKRHFADPSLAAAMLGATPERLMSDLTAFGCLLESLAVRDLRIYSQAQRATVFHYRDSGGLEADAIIERADGSWVAAEVKLNTSPKVIDSAAKTLLRLKQKTTRQRTASMAALLVITPTGAAYRRPDGVQVAPITALGP
ncbi:MAG: DUF4143 domain-containing protein [bacterium]|nr:DUF4143 domain-containing protein [bacterium]MCY3891303.1 DUF4143 domain-containing protein [bacterium]